MASQVEDVLSRLVLDDKLKTFVVENLSVHESKSLACSNTTLALTTTSNDEKDKIDINVSHEGDPFLYAKYAELKSSSARKERKLPICRWLNSNQHLHQSVDPRETIGLVSYPRSGNSMLRNMLEQHYGIFTGSDTRPDRTLSRALRDQWGMTGEGVVDNRLVKIVKSHWPERQGWCPVKVNRIILLVRNPFDAIDSYFNMCLTNTHHLSLSENVYEQFRSTWEEMMCAEASLWAAFNNFWLKCGIPLFVIRYEDLRETKQSTFAALIRWIDKREINERNDNKDPSNIVCSQTSSTSPSLIPKESSAEEKILNVSSPYQPRAGGGLGKSLHRFDIETLKTVRKNAGIQILKSFNYDPGPMIEKNIFEKGQTIYPDMTKRPNYENGKCELKSKNGINNVILNDSKVEELRNHSNKFGRYMTTFRRMHTFNDTQPLEVVSGEPYRDLNALKALTQNRKLNENTTSS